LKEDGIRVVIAISDNYNLTFFNLVYKAMFTVDPAGPAISKLKTEGYNL